MAIGEAFSASVKNIALGGEGLADYEGKRVFIPLSAPGDLVRARITQDHGDWARAELLEVCEPGPNRIEPPCPLYGQCGGCSLQHLSYDAQLAAKKDILTNVLGRTGGAAKAAPKSAEDAKEFTLRVISSKPWEYRNRVSLHALRSNRFPRCAFMARKSGDLIPLEDCPACDPGIRRILPRLLPPPGKDRFTLYSRGDVLLAETGASCRTDGSVPSTAGSRDSFPARGTITLSLPSDLPASSPDLPGNPPGSSMSREITLDAASFFQSNAAALETLLTYVRLAAEEAVKASSGGVRETFADLYAGVGTFSLFLADLFPGGADLLEADSRALELAKINLDRLRARPETKAGSPGAFRFFAQKDQQWVKKNNVGAYDFVIADPPRQGLSPALAASLAEQGPPVFVYVSCEPSSFARDYRILARRYALQSLVLFDFYPQTAHIECMGTFVQK